MNKLISLFLVSCFLLMTEITANTPDSQEKQPNILFFLVDDMGWMDVAYNGSSVYETPNIDKLATESIQFTNAYVTHPRCVPSRYSILTGKYPARIKRPGPGKMKLEEFTIAEALKETGYATFFTGKWHLSMGGPSMPDNQGFDVNIGGGKAGAPISYFYPYNEPPHHQFTIPIVGLEEGEEGEYLSDRLTHETINCIEKHVDAMPDVPFFAMLSHYAVHEPIEAKDEDVNYYQRKIEKHTFEHPEYIKESHGLSKMRQDNATYAGMVKSVDESLQQVMLALEEMNIADNTIIVFFSDNGGLSNTGTEERLLATSNYPLRAGKGHLYEGGVRVPLLIKWPQKQKRGTSSDVVITGADLYPTLLEMVGADLQPQQHLDGVSFKSLFDNEPNPVPDRSIFWHNAMARPARTGDYYSSAVRKGPYKLIDFYKKGYMELYNLENDPQEENNLIETHAYIADSLKKEIIDWRVSVDAYFKPDNKKSKWD
ncbi:sulfatase [Carboxylicivirga marina]|uniref:Sulfatase n=1 Tax=Carboxylicivirga marina TaxID=2800988 RepID=A0ABS1HKT9_9BACT|nr:sulfatase [Carboxylicivirga marina]MBK3518221.1 sulfatase [Carboxylicivirga marina]